MNISKSVLIQFLIFLILTVSFLSANICAQIKSGNAMELRVESLLRKLTLDEKISLVAGTGFDTVPIKRLGIPALNMTDGPAGVRQAPSSSFPSGIALAATFDPKLIFSVGQAIGQEAKAKGKNVLLAPSVNIQRVPQAGRNFETFGEDPFLSAQMSVAYIKGVQSENVIATVKHFAVNNQERDRMSIDARVDERALQEIYLPAFRASVKQANVWAVMAAYNKINGFHATENDYLLTEILKKRWGFKGLVMSDWTAVKSLVPTIKSGLDLEMPTGTFLNPESIKKALDSKEISILEINEMVRRILRTIILAGIMDGKLDKGSIDTPEHRKVALEAARAGIVLLKNYSNDLPLDANKIRSIAVIGPNANVARIGGGGSAQVIPFYSVSPLQGIKARLGDKVQVNFAPGVVALEDTEPIPNENLQTPDGKSKGIQGEYFANLEMLGEPQVKRIEPQVNFRWTTNAPLENFPNDQFSTRWTGNLVPTVSGRYAISLSSNDGGRLYLDDKLIVDVWGDHASLKGATIVELKAGVPRKIRIEHYENRGNADLVLGWRRLEDNSLKEAVEIAKKSDTAVLFLGLSDAVEVETRDRPDLDLPQDQQELVEAVVKANPKTIVVMTTGAPVLMNKWIDKVPAVLQAFYYGQEGGNAIADVLFGKISPSGKLPATFLKRWEDSPAYNHYPGNGKSVNYDEGIFVGYRWFDTKHIEPLFPFGYGLSYTLFEYSNLKLIKGKTSKDPIVTVQFDIENIGKSDGAEVAQIYVRDLQSSLARPDRELKGFEKVFIKMGEKKTVSIPLRQNSFAFYDPQKKAWLAEKGDFKILVGSSSRNIRLDADFNLPQTLLEK